MQNLFKLLTLTVFLFGIYSCSNNTEQQDSSANEPMTEISPEDAERRANMQTEWTINEIIDLWVNNLDERLTLSNEVKSGIKNAYSNAYASSRGNLDDKVDRDQARELRQQIVKETEHEVLAFLTEDQANFYKRFYENK